MMSDSATADRRQAVATCAMPGRPARVLLVCLLLMLFGSLLQGCSAPVRAPVVSREHAQPQPRTTRPASYRVKSGDTLYAIAWRYGINFSSVARWNGIRAPYTIYPGQWLRLTPAGNRSVASRSTGKPPQTTSKPPKKNAVVSNNAVSKPKERTKRPAAPTNPATAQSIKLHWTWPTTGKVVERFVRGDPVRKGVKIRGRHGETVRAAESGKVVYAGNGLIGYGRLVIIKHNKNYLSAYGHNRKIHVKEGDTVKKGFRIAEMGSGGDGKPVLHFEIRRNGAPVDPLRLLPRHP